LEPVAQRFLDLNHGKLLLAPAPGRLTPPLTRLFDRIIGQGPEVAHS
jgi:hypothetical protein